MDRTIENQLAALETPVRTNFIKTDKDVKGPYTSGDYIRWMLSDVFGADNWQFTVLDGPRIVELNPSNCYVQTLGRLVVQFANGNQITHDDVGVWPLVSGRDDKGQKKLADAAPERFETVLKASVTDALKACAEQLGVCFRPIADKTLDTCLRSPRKPVPPPDGGNPAADSDLVKKIKELFGDDAPVATAWLIKRYTAMKTPRNKRERLDNLADSEKAAILGMIAENPALWQRHFGAYLTSQPGHREVTK